MVLLNDKFTTKNIHIDVAIFVSKNIQTKMCLNPLLNVTVYTLTQMLVYSMISRINWSFNRFTVFERGIKIF